jgi:hypothetical protein
MEINDFVNCFIKGLRMYYLSHTKDGTIHPNIVPKMGWLTCIMYLAELKLHNVVKMNVNHLSQSL